MSPVPKSEPEIESKLKTVTIRLRDTLEANTTYTLNFGNAVRDVNESNIARNFTYIFSTGSTFDSLTLSGKVILAANGKVDSTLVVMLHKNGDDSAVVNEKPRYLARLDSSGNFRFRNLPWGTFYIYALQDQGYDTVESNLRLGFAVDARDFGIAAAMLRLLSQDKVRLLTNNPAKVAGLEAAGITVAERVPHKLPPNPHNAHYLEVKRDRTGHLL